MTNRVIGAMEVSLNGVWYPVASPPRPFLASVFPQKITIGDRTKDDEPFASTVIWSDFRGGIGVNRFRLSEPGDINRCWWSTCGLRWPGLIVPSTQATNQTSNVRAFLSGLALLPDDSGNNYLYFVDRAAAGTYDVYRSDQNEADVDTGVNLTAEPTDVIAFRTTGGPNPGTRYLVYAEASQIDYTSDVTNGTTWASDTTDIDYLAFWDGKLWGIDATTGQAYWTFDPASGWNQVERLALGQPDLISDLFTGPDGTGEEQLYCATEVGLFIRDSTAGQWRKTSLQIPQIRYAGRNTVVWRDAIYFKAGMAIYEYHPGRATIRSIGPDQDHGLPAAYVNHEAYAMYATHNELLVSTVAISGTQAPIILGWDGRGWQYIATVATTSGSRRISDMIACTRNGTYYLYYAVDAKNGANDITNVRRMQLYSNLTNPDQISTYTYTDGMTLETPWFDGGWSDADKLALRVKVGVEDADANDTLKVEYRLNFDDATTYTLGTITSSGRTTYNLEQTLASGNANGLVFQSIKFVLTWANGASTTTAKLNYLSLAYIKMLDDRWGWEVDVDANRGHRDQTAMQLMAALRTAIENNNLIEFTFRDDSSNSRNYWVKVLEASMVERTGHDERGLVHLKLIEP